MAEVVDVMVPAYGDGTLLRETVRSVLAQDRPDWRLTVVDDGASTGSDGDLREWLDGLGDHRVRYLANPVRLGINRNFQRCVDEAHGEFVVLLGSDDRLLPHFVGRALDVMTRFPDAGFVHTGATVIDVAGRPALPLADRVKSWASIGVTDCRAVGGEELAASLLRGNWMYFPSVVFRGDVLRQHGFREGYDIVLDLDLYLRIVLAGWQAVLLERPCIEYRRHAASLSSAHAVDGTRFDEEIAYFGEAARMVADMGWHRAARAARWHWTSRLHTMARIPGLVAGGRARTAGCLLRTAFAGALRDTSRAGGRRAGG